MRTVLLLPLAVTLGTPMFAGCSAKIEETPEYLAACEGPPLRTVAKRVQAQEDGYDVNKQFDCIDKASFAAKAEAHAAYLAANTPEAIEEQRRKHEQDMVRYAEEWKRREAAEEQSRPHIRLARVDANTAPESDIAGIFAVGPEVAADIVSERAKRPFAGWDDLVSRVVGMSAAQSAFAASTCGLTVDGQSMRGAPIDADTAAALYERRYGKQAVIELAP